MPQKNQEVQTMGTEPQQRLEAKLDLMLEKTGQLEVAMAKLGTNQEHTTDLIKRIEEDSKGRQAQMASELLKHEQRIQDLEKHQDKASFLGAIVKPVVYAALIGGLAIVFRPIFEMNLRNAHAPNPSYYPAPANPEYIPPHK